MSLLQKSRSVELSRRTQPFYAKKQSYNLGQQVQVEVDTQREFLDMESLRIQFKVVTTAGGGAGNSTTNKCFASTCIRNLRVKTLAGQMIGHEIREYRGFAQWKLRHLKKQETSRTTLVDKMEMITPYAFSAGSNKTFKCSHKPLAHIFGLKEYYPAHFHQGLMIEFDLPQVARELFYGSADSSDNIPSAVTFEDVRILVDLVELKPELENEMVRLMEEQKLFVDYIEWLSQENTIESGSPAYDVVGIDGRVKSAFVFWGSQLTTGTPDYTEKYWELDNDRNGITNYRFRLGSRYLNYANIQVGDEDDDAERVYELSKALDLHHNLMDGKEASYGDITADLTNDYGIGVKVDKAMSEVDEVISSQVDKDRNNMRVELTGVSASRSRGYTYVVLDKRLQLLPGSVVRNVRA